LIVSAAVKLGRNFKGIELVPKYFNIAKSRINAVQNRSS
jgi:DNA modification methylase